jgi:hypothetical protein
MLGSASDWATKFNNLPKVADSSWADNMATAVDDLTTGKLELTNIQTTPASFTFGKPAFKTALMAVTPTTSASAGALNFATAWELGMLGSFMLVTPGASVGVPTPATIFSIVGGTIVDPPSLIIAKAGLVSAISGLGAASNADAFASAFRDAFLALTYTTSGTNSIVPVPTPLVDPLDPAK